MVTGSEQTSQIAKDVRFAFDAEGGDLMEVTFDNVRAEIQSLIRYAENSLLHRTEKTLRVAEEALSECAAALRLHPEAESVRMTGAVEKAHNALANIRSFRDKEAQSLEPKKALHDDAPWK